MCGGFRGSFKPQHPSFSETSSFKHQTAHREGVFCSSKPPGAASGSNCAKSRRAGESAQLTGAFFASWTCESGSKLPALQTLRDAAHDCKILSLLILCVSAATAIGQSV